MPLMRDSDIAVNAALAVSRDPTGNTFNCSQSATHQVTASGGNIICAFTNLKPGQDVTLRFIQDGVGGRTLTVSNPVVRTVSAMTLVPTAGAGEETYYRFHYDGTLLLLLTKV